MAFRGFSFIHALLNILRALIFLDKGVVHSVDAHPSPTNNANVQTKSQKIIDILNEIIPILDMVEPDNFTDRYADLLRFYLKTLNGPHVLSKIAREMITLFGGMGSFNDVVIYQNENVIKEHDLFDKKRTELFIACRDAL